ncbi:MAG: PAS domain-containing protein [bacterium]|nr:PAS domain-containing protein [bacterium]
MASNGRGSKSPRREAAPAAAEAVARPLPDSRLLAWRLGFAAFLTAATVILLQTGSDRVAGPGLVVGLGLLYTSLAASWAASMAGVPQRLLVGLQLGADVLILGLLVHFSGGPYSALPLVFCVPIVLAARYLGGRGALAVAGAAAAFTGGGHFGLALGWLLAGREAGATYVVWWPVTVTSLHMAIFLAVGLVAGDLGRRTVRRKRRSERATRPTKGDAREVRNILDNIRSGVLMVDREGRINRINPMGCRTLGLAEQDALGRDLRLVTAGGLDDLAGAILPVAAGGKRLARSEVIVRTRGRETPLGLNVNHVIGTGGRIEGAIAIFTDLTREKELSARVREADRLAAVGELAASIAHEIRNPLASIRGSVEILAGDVELEGYQAQLLDLVLKESSRVNTIINDFLAYSRMRPATKRRFSGQEFRDEITLQIRQHIAAKDGDVRVTCEVSPENLLVVADQGQLTQMALNLAINACEAMGYVGSLRIGLNDSDAGETCELVVEDDGPGIDPEIHRDLFRPFKTTKTGGTGLGLSVVAHIATAHGGNVAAESAPGGGALFRVRWPQGVLLDPEEDADLVTAPASQDHRTVF